MHAMIGFALSLALSTPPPPPDPWDGNNGFDPTSIFLLKEGSSYLIDPKQSADFDNWLKKDPQRRAAAVRYFVTCAFEKDVLITSKSGYQWRGALGLAPSLKAILLRLPDSGGKGHYPGVSLAPAPNDGQWVSACLMALANAAGSHQYVHLRGSPRVWHDVPDLNPVSPRKAWTFGSPEGVFFADLLNFNVVQVGTTTEPAFVRRDPPFRSPPGATLQKSYTMSLNLPEDYPGIPGAGWAPPNASLGRTLDFDHLTFGKLPPPTGMYRVASRLGEYPGPAGAFVMSSPVHDGDYPFDTVCVASGSAVVPCKLAEVQRYRPLFIHAPRLVSLATTTLPDPSLTMQALYAGPGGLTDGQRLDCEAGASCIGPIGLFSVGEPPVAPTNQASKMLGGLRSDQSVTAVLRFVKGKELINKKPYELKAGDWSEPFTAIVRYRSKVDTRARIEVSHNGPAWRDLGEVTFPKTCGWEWMQIYPVYLVNDEAKIGPPSLKVRVSGLDVDGWNTPTLDVAGFVSNWPWCLKDVSPKEGTPAFAGVCREVEALP
jgi:hypothetical protein